MGELQDACCEQVTMMLCWVALSEGLCGCEIVDASTRTQANCNATNLRRTCHTYSHLHRMV